MYKILKVKKKKEVVKDFTIQPFFKILCSFIYKLLTKTFTGRLRRRKRVAPNCHQREILPTHRSGPVARRQLESAEVVGVESQGEV